MAERENFLVYTVFSLNGGRFKEFQELFIYKEVVKAGLCRVGFTLKSNGCRWFVLSVTLNRSDKRFLANVLLMMSPDVGLRIFG